MLNRRLLRIKVFQAIYAYQQDKENDTKGAKSFLKRSVDQLEDAYVFLLNLPLELRYFVENEQNPEEVLYVPTQRDIETGKTFIYNKLINILDHSDELKLKSKKVGKNWSDNKDVMRIIFNGFKTSEHFQKYLAKPKKDFAAQKELILAFFKSYLPKHEELNELMEDLFIHWNDDQKAVFNGLSRTLDDITEDTKAIALRPLSDDLDEDWEFCSDLLDITLKNQKEYIDLISAKTKKWDTERIADVDLILMTMSVCELLNFPTIPVKVSINEYLEVSKVYSTPKSSVFLNGILDKLMNEFKKEGKITKVGRGLVE